MRFTMLAAVLASWAFAGPALADDARDVQAARVAARELLAARQDAFCDCFDASARKGRLIADATLYFVVGARGRATEVQVKTPGYVPQSLVRCLKAELKTLRFPTRATSLVIEHRLHVLGTF